jgi:hypothetical protein
MNLIVFELNPIELEFNSIEFQYNSNGFELYLNLVQFKNLSSIEFGLKSIEIWISIQEFKFKLHAMSFNIFIQMELNFQIFFHHFIINGNA